MKYILFGALLALWLPAQSQEIQFNSDSASYSIVDTTLSGGKTDLHRKAQGWAIDMLGDSGQVIRLDDMDTGELTGEASVPLETKTNMTFRFRVSSRDREYRCEIFAINLDQKGKSQDFKELMGKQQANKGAKLVVDKKVRQLLSELQRRMRTEENYAQPSIDTLPD